MTAPAREAAPDPFDLGAEAAAETKRLLGPPDPEALRKAAVLLAAGRQETAAQGDTAAA